METIRNLNVNTSPPVTDLDPAAASRACPQPLPQGGGSQAPTPLKRSLRVLCIDDDEQFLEMMKDCLSYYEHQIRVASGGKHGIELFCTAILKSEPYDVVITDLRMPDMDGYQVAQMIKEESPRTPIIIMTGESTSAPGGGKTPAAVDFVVNKPPRMQELNELLLRIAV
jgi:DNA-binding NtrC family response regulator